MSEKRLPFLILILPVMSLLLSVFLFVAIYVSQQKKIMSENLKYIENLYINHAVNIEKNKIKSAFDVILNDYEHINDIVKPKLKNRVNMAYNIIMSIYRNNRDLPKKKLVKIVKDAIRPIRFDNGEGYFFIYNMKGVNILLPPDRSIEGRNMLNIKDAKGNFIIKKGIELAKTKGGGFLKWYWFKPVNYYITRKSKVYEKIGYIRYVKPFNWFVGTGIYIKSELYRMEDRFIKFYEKEKEKNGEYFIVLRPLGKNEMKILANSNRPYLSGSVVSYKFMDVNGYSYFPLVFNLLKEGKKEGIIKYKYLSNGKSNKEIILYVFYKKLDMLVLYGFNLNSVESIVEKAQKQYKIRLYKYMKESIILSFVIILIVGVLFLFIAQKVNMVFFKYKREVEEKEEKLEKLALYDNLTQVYNRNKFNEILKYEINMSKRYNLPLSLIMFDLDHFKRVNDKYGHATGDKVLQKIAKTVQDSIRLTDTLARWGGEEFFIILPKTDVDKAKKIAETLRAKIEDIDFKNIGKVTCSFGVTGLKKDDNEEKFIKRADEAMYLAKKNGRNRVELL